MGTVRQNPIQRTVSLFICVCIALRTIVAHNIAQNRPDGFPPYPPDDHHSSDDVYLRYILRTYMCLEKSFGVNTTIGTVAVARFPVGEAYLAWYANDICYIFHNAESSPVVKIKLKTRTDQRKWYGRIDRVRFPITVP